MDSSFRDSIPVRAIFRSACCAVFIVVLLNCSRWSAPPPRPTAGHPKPYRVMGKWYQPIPDAAGFRQRGLASWYGEPFHGRKTASGERYNMHAMTGAHKTLPLGTYVRVHNLDNNRSTVVKINDRGPFVRGRIIDLSLKAARVIGMQGAGTAPVKIVALGPAGPGDKTSQSVSSRQAVNYFRGVFTVQVGAFADRANAVQFKNRLAQKYKNAHIKPFFDGKQTLFRVRVGRCYTLQKAAEYEAALIRHGFKDAFAVAE